MKKMGETGGESRKTGLVRGWSFSYTVLERTEKRGLSMDYFWEQGLLSAGVLLLFFASIACQIFMAYHLLKLIGESAMLEEEPPKLLKEWMNQYTKDADQISNIPAFVDKSIQEYRAGRFTFLEWKHLGGQLLLLGVFLSGIGACKGIIEGRTLGDILPFYIICLLGLYLHFSVSGYIDMEEKKKVIRTNLLDFLENHKQFLWKDSFVEPVSIKKEENTAVFGPSEDEQLKELLREILA